MVPRQGPAHSRTPRWPRFQVYAGCVPLAPPPTEDFVPYNFLSLAVPPGYCSHLSSRPLPHYHGNSGRRSLHSTEQGPLLVPFAHTTIMQNRAFSVVGPLLWNRLSLMLQLFPRIVSNSLI